MKQRTLQTAADLRKASADILGLEGHLPVVITVTQGKRIRSDRQNSKYWATLNDHLQNISNWVQQLADETGHTSMEIRHFVASQLSPEYAAIVYAFTDDSAHKVMKIIQGKESSRKLGTKEFMDFEQRMDQIMSEIVGEVQAVAKTMGVAA